MTWLFIPCLILASLLSVGHADFFLSVLIGLTGIAGAAQLATGRWQMGALPAPLSWALLSFGLWAGLSTLWSDAPFDSWRAVSVWLLLPIWAWIFAAQDIKSLQTKFVAMMGILFLLVLIAYIQIAGGAPYAGYRPPSLFANPNTFGSLLVAVLLPLQHLWLGRAEVCSRPFTRGCVAVVLFVILGALVFSASRIAIVGYGVFTIAQMFWLRDTINTHRKEFIGFIAGLVVTYIVMNILADNVLAGRLALFTDIALSKVRMLVYETAWESYLQTPVTGHGFGALYASYAGLRHYDDNTLGQFAHSDMLQYLAELGPLGLLLAASIFGLFAVMTVSRLHQGFKDPQSALWFAAVSLGIAATALASCVTYLLYLPVILLVLALMFGIWSSLFWSEEEPLEARRKPVSALAFLGVMGALTCLHVSAVMTDQASLSIMRYSMKDHYKWNLIASRLSFDLNPSVLMEWADVSQSFTSQDKKPKQIALLRGTLDRLERLQPKMPEYWLLRGRFELIGEDFKAAESAFRKAVALDPTFVPARVMLGRLLRETGRDAEIPPLYEEGLKYALVGAKYGVHDMDEMIVREKNLPRLTKSRY